MKWPCCACCGTDRGARCNFPRSSIVLGHYERCVQHQAPVPRSEAPSWTPVRPAAATLRPWWKP